MLYCEALPADHSAPCASSPGTLAGRLACLARDNNITVAVNLCEAAGDGRNYNTQVGRRGTRARHVGG